MTALDIGAARNDPGATTLDVDVSSTREAPGEERGLGLVVIWWQGEPRRVGEVLLPGREPSWFGRAVAALNEARLSLLRQRPGHNECAAPITNPFVSRRHLRLTALEDSIEIECCGKQPLCVDGSELESAEVRRGDVVEVRGVCSFLCVERAHRLAAGPTASAFGAADVHGIVGESPAIWDLRDRISFVASRSAHVLVTGASGTGKELVARAIHGQSARSKKAMVARNAATLPPALIDAELFGNAASYPNAGMAERPGLIGQAEGSTLFLDEIGELPTELHAHLLRVLDAGEYQRLGDARTRCADFRFVAATNRPVTSLKPDLAARLAVTIDVPGLDRRPEDITLLARHLVQRIAARDPELAARYLVSGGAVAHEEPRLSSELARALTQHQYSTHVRELSSLLWRSMQSSSGGVLECTGEVRELLRPRPSARAPEDVSPEELRSALVRHAGVKERVWRELGLSSRHALLRLMKKLGET
jgi:DNA-binding NtrC family response regulator